MKASDLSYCQENLDYLSQIEKLEEDKAKLPQAALNQALQQSKKLDLVINIVAVILILLSLVYQEIWLATLIVALAIIGFVWLTRDHGLSKNQMSRLEQEQKQMQAQIQKLQAKLNSEGRLPDDALTPTHLQQLIHYFQRDEAQSLDQALYFLKLDEIHHF